MTNHLAPSGGAMCEVATAESAHADTATPAWYVIATKRNREDLARAFLAQRGIESYGPRVLQWPRPAVGAAVAPMFPGYLFVHAALPSEYYRVLWNPGVKAFVTFGGAPGAVDRGIVDFLREREGPDGVIRCGDALANGSEVRIVNGPFRGLTAVVEQRLAARDRVRVLMNILQRETSVELPDRWVRRA